MKVKSCENCRWCSCTQYGKMKPACQMWIDESYTSEGQTTNEEEK